MFKFQNGENNYRFYQTRYGIECCMLDADGNNKDCRISTEVTLPTNEEEAKAALKDDNWFPSEELLDKKLFAGGLCRLESRAGDKVRVFSKDKLGKYSFNDLMKLGFMSDLDKESIKGKRATEMMNVVADFCASNDISYMKLFKEEADAVEFAEFLHDGGFVE